MSGRLIAIFRRETRNDGLEITISHRSLEAVNHRAGIFILRCHRFLSRPLVGLESISLHEYGTK
jgi:hypothetical protein